MANRFAQASRNVGLFAAEVGRFRHHAGRAPQTATMPNTVARPAAGSSQIHIGTPGPVQSVPNSGDRPQAVQARRQRAPVNGLAVVR